MHLLKFILISLTLFITCVGGDSSLEDEQIALTIIGARGVESTPVDKGTLFASIEGNEYSCSHDKPCSIQTAFSQLKAGDVLFLRGGEYTITASLIPAVSGTADNPIIIESYPAELAILEGNYITSDDVNNNPDERTSGIRLGNDHNSTIIRKIEIRYMGWAGVNVYGSHNIIEGCHVHHNKLTGIALYGGVWREDDEDYVIPYLYGYNIVRDNIVNDNSDEGLAADGGNSDGISISSGKFNTIIHNTVYANSDDGIDTWRSNDTSVEFNLVYDQGRGSGDGNGIKAGGNSDENSLNGLNAVVKHNIVYANRAKGLDYNSGKNVIFQYNTSYNNQTDGVTGADDTTVEYNIGSNNGRQDSDLGNNNSWNTQENITFLSTDPNSNNFLKPEVGSDFESMGAYANPYVKIFPISIIYLILF